MPRIIAMIPTFNEAENIGPLLDALLALEPPIEALVVDDDSPDGTWKQVEERLEDNPRVHLLHRMVRRGRGLAGIAGFCEALRIGADAVIEMDADWSHDPKWIPSMLALMEREAADVVIASRLVSGGGEAGRPASRRWITHLANFYIRGMLRLPVRDATSGFRIFSRRCLEALPWDAMRATGPEVVQEVLLAAHARGFKIVEAPFTFVERRFGESTFNRKIMMHSLGAMWRLRNHPGRLVPQPATEGADPALPISQNLTPLPGLLTVPMSWLYGAGRSAHRAWIVSGPGQRLRLPAPVICVGNLTVGGTGKTPMVGWIATQCQARGFKPAIVSRGYGAEEKLVKPLIVSDGQRLLASASQAGDEPRWLAEHCPGVPVAVHPNRHRAGLAVINRYGADLVVLDDGFQHDHLRRDLDLVLWDLGDEPERMRLLPAGRLREGLGALRRASAIILTHGEYLPEELREARIDQIIRRLKLHAPEAPIFESETVIEGFERVSGRIRADAGEEEGGRDGAWPWSGRRVLAISGLARPLGFEAMLRGSGALIAQHLVYSDHFAYHADLVTHWREALRRHDAEMIVTTAKDAVKLAELPLFGLPVAALSIAMRVKDAVRWEAFLAPRLAAMRQRRK